MRSFIAVLIAWLFDEIAFWRIWVSIVVGFMLVGVSYVLIAPTELPFWPAAIAIGFSGLVGLFWERHADS